MSDFKNENGFDVAQGVVKNKKKPVAAIVAGIVAVLAIGSGLTYALVPSVRNNVKMAIMGPEKYFAETYKSNIKNSKSELIENYQLMYDSLDKMQTGTAVKCNVNFELQDGMKQMLSMANMGEMFNEVNFDMYVNMKENKLEETFKIAADGKDVVSASMFGDMKDMIFYAQVPDLTANVLKIPYKEMLSEEMGDMVEVPEELQQVFDMDYSNMKEYFLETNQVDEIITRYTDIIIDGITDVEIEKGVTGKVGKIDYKYNKMVANISSKDAAKIADNLIKELENDKVIKKYVVDTYGISESDYATFIEEAKEEIPDLEEITDEKIILTTYVDEKGTIQGMEMGETAEEEMFSMISAESKNQVAMQMNMENSAIVNIDADKDGNKYTGKISCEADGETYSVDFEDLELVDKKYINGVINLDMKQFGVEDMGNIALNFTTDGKSQTVENKMDNMYKLTLKYEEVSPTDVKIPDENVYGIEEMDKFLGDADINAFLKNIFVKLGMDEATAEMLAENYAGGGLDYGYEEYEDGEEVDLEEDYDLGDLDDYGYDYDLKNAIVKFNENAITLPGSNAEIISMLGDTGVEAVEPAAYEYLYSEDGSIGVTVKNDTKESITVDKATITSIYVYGETSALNLSINDIKIGSTVEEIEKAFGIEVPEDEYDVSFYKDSNFLSFSLSDGKVSSLTISIE